jgi:DNA-binding NarL/FixJ family response regulator
LYRRCGATSDVSRLDDGTSREAAGASPEMAAAAGLLSPRERQVAILAAGGLSNLEIGRELSITHKTVEKHLASVYRKLAMSSRAKLDAYVPAQSPSAVIVSRSR